MLLRSQIKAYMAGKEDSIGSKKIGGVWRLSSRMSDCRQIGSYANTSHCNVFVLSTNAWEISILYVCTNGSLVNHECAFALVDGMRRLWKWKMASLWVELNVSA